MAHFEVGDIAAEECQCSVIDRPSLPCVQLPGLHDGEVHQVTGTDLGLPDLRVD